MNRYTFLFIISVLFVFDNCDTPIPNDTGNQLREIYFISRYTGERSFFLIFVPQNADSPCPVVYLLNGGGASPYAWISGAELQDEAEKHKMIIVSLTSGRTGNYPYVDSAVDSTLSYESYVLEIVKIVDDNFDTEKTRFGRGIGGISNGAMGAIYVASKNPDMFISVSALSGGTYDTYPPDYDGLINMNLIMDVGLSDNMVLANMRFLHNTLESKGIEHIYEESPGFHDWTFWGRHYKKHLRFHRDIFDSY